MSLQLSIYRIYQTIPTSNSSSHAYPNQDHTLLTQDQNLPTQNLTLPTMDQNIPVLYSTNKIWGYIKSGSHSSYQGSLSTQGQNHSTKEHTIWQVTYHLHTVGQRIARLSKVSALITFAKSCLVLVSMTKNFKISLSLGLTN